MIISNEYRSIYHYCMESFTIILIFNAAMSAHLQMDINLITFYPLHVYLSNEYISPHAFLANIAQCFICDEISQTSLQEISSITPYISTFALKRASLLNMLHVL